MVAADPLKIDVPVEKKENETKGGEMTEEDTKLKEDLDNYVEKLKSSDTGSQASAIRAISELVRASTTSMTSVPKPLKFMRPHFDTIKTLQAAWPEGLNKAECADLISVLAMTSDSSSDCLHYRLKGTQEPIGNWGLEYVRHLTKEIADEWKTLPEKSEKRETLMRLTHQVVEHHMKHNAEVEAVDLLVEIERLDVLEKYVDEATAQRVCLYLLACSPMTPDPDNRILISTAKDIHLKFKQFLEATRCAMMLNDDVEIKRIFPLAAADVQTQMQMAIMLGRNQFFLDFDALPNGDKLGPLNANTSLFEHFLALARELDIMEPKTPEGIYKSHLEASRRGIHLRPMEVVNTGPFGSSVAPDSARLNLAGAFVNGFVNCGFGVEKMMTDQDSANRWFFKNKEYGMLSAAASQGLVWRWNIDEGLTQCDRFLYVTEDYIKAGTLLAIGIISSGIQDPCDPASAILLDHVHSDRSPMRVGSVLGLGLAYANSKRETVVKEEEGGVVFELRKVLACAKESATPEVRGLAALSLGLILVGTQDWKVAKEILDVLIEKGNDVNTDSHCRFLALGIALIFLGSQEKCEVMMESVRCLPDPFGSMIGTLIEVVAYAGSGNVLKIQKMLHICSEHYEVKEEKKEKKIKKGAAAAEDKKKEEPKKDDGKLDLSSQQAVAVIGIGLIAMGDDISREKRITTLTQMSVRTFSNLMRYGEPVIRRAVPLGMALTSVSNPDLLLMDRLGKFSHDSDAHTCHSALFALGLLGAGTNNARLVNLLRSLASFHHKDQVSLMLVRMAQGLIHLGKGTMTLNAYHSDRQMMCPSSIAGLITLAFAFLDAPNSVLSNRQHYLFYTLSLAMQPRMLVTLLEDEKGQLKRVNVPVRVGQAVDVVGQAGRPKTITGFQTHKTPVLLGHGDRAELATEEYVSVTPYLEGVVILKKNDAYVPPPIMGKLKP